MGNTRIAMLSEHASPLTLLGGEDAGGQNVYVSEVSVNLAKQGYQVDVFTRRDNKGVAEVTEWAEGVRIISLGAGTAASLKKDQLLRFMPEFCTNLVKFSQERRLRYGLIHANFWMSGWVACELKALWHVPFVEIFHALGKVKRLHQGNADTSPEERIPIEMRIVDEANKIIAQCPSEKEELLGMYGASDERIIIVPSAVDTQTFKPVQQRQARETLGLPLEEQIFLYVGRILPRKGIDNIILALAKITASRTRPPRLLIVGGDTEEISPDNHEEVKRLYDLAATVGVAELLTFVGRRRQSVLKEYYSAADVCVSTPWYEPFGLVPLEAMACGTPMIVSEVGGMKFTVQDGKTGFHVPPKDPAALARRIELVLDNPALRDELGRRARERVEQYFTWPQVARRTATVYAELLETPDLTSVPRAR